MALFEIVTTQDGAIVGHLASDLAGAIETLGLTVAGVETRAALRPELRGLPKLRGFVGPCHGGERLGQMVVRYEDTATYIAMGV